MGISAGVVDESTMLTNAVDPTCKVRAASEYSFMESVSAPSVIKSLASVCVKVNLPVASIVPSPVRAPAEKSAVVIPVPLKA